MLPTYWVIFLSATLIFHPTSTFNGESALILALFCAAFLFGSTYATMEALPFARPALKIDSSSRAGYALHLSSMTVIWAIAMGSLANLVAAALALRNSPYGFWDILSLQGLADSTNSLAVSRYAGEDSNMFIFLLLGIGYASALVAPFIRLTTANRQIWWTILPSLTSVAYAAVTSARLGFLVAAALTVGGMLACTVLRDGEVPKIRLKMVIGSVVVASLIAGAFIGIGVLRTGRIDMQAVITTVNKQASYTVGSVGAFSSWYGDYGTGQDQQLGFGTATIAGVEYFTGQDRSATRAYGEFAVIDQTGRTSNVYTVFRGLLLDFGVAGTLIFLALTGFLFGRLYLRSRAGSVASAGLLGFGYASIFLSGWLATTTFTNVLFVAVAGPTLLILARRRFLTEKTTSGIVHARRFTLSTTVK